MGIRLTSSISISELSALTEERFGDLVKAVIDIKRSIMAVGGEMHSDEETLLLTQGSQQEDLWGINIYPAQPDDKLIECDSMINIRPTQGNRSRDIENPEIKATVERLAQSLIKR